MAMANSPCKDGTVRRRGSTPAVWPISLVEAEARLGIRIAEGLIHAQRTGLLIEMQQVHSFLGRLRRSHSKTPPHRAPAGPVGKVVIAQSQPRYFNRLRRVCDAENNQAVHSGDALNKVMADNRRNPAPV